MQRLGRERALPLLLDRYPRMQGWRRAYFVGEVHGKAALAAAPAGAARPFWEAAYPRAFPALVDRYGPPAGNPDFFLHSIMRKESGFLPTEVSVADARGLLQLLPQVGDEVTSARHEPFAAEELFVPEVNVRLGSLYIGALARRFRGNVALAAGSFHAGWQAMIRWCDKNGTRPLDDFVELVTFDITREYIRRVVPIYASYQYLYGKTPWEPSLETAGCRYEGGPPKY
jgi:soluble lytic murein transglycosylase